MKDITGQCFGDYRIVRLIAHGGQASVYLAQHERLPMQAAVKILHTHLTEPDMEGFRREAHTLSALIHPNIVRILDFDVQNDLPFLVMDYAPHGTLRQQHPVGNRLPHPIIISYIKQVASALQYAHEQKLIHRDIKPENMLLGRSKEVLLSDFGIAVATQSTKEPSTDLAGTIPYMAPEQIEGHPRPASDQYSLAVIAYEWLSGTRPFNGSYMEIASQHYLIPPPSLRARVPGLPPEVEEVVMHALAKNPKQRFGSVQAFANALEQALLPASLSTKETPAHRTPPSTSQPIVVALPDPPTLIHRPTPLETPIHSEPMTEGVHSSRTSRNRHRLISKVYAFWINGVLKQSIQGTDLVTLGLHEQQEANTRNLAIYETENTTRSLPPNTHIGELFQRTQESLLILGEPGCGKTTLMLELTRELLKRARNDENYPMPVVFNLSSWATRRQSLKQWLIEELLRNYQVSRRLGESWLETDQILPLLDGLDEVAQNQRAACVEAINSYRQEHGLVPLVITCRVHEYGTLSKQLNIRRAIVVQPLTFVQINEYLLNVGNEANALREALRTDPALHELARTPLMLTILLLAYKGTSVDDELRKNISPVNKQEHVFTAYVQRMLYTRRDEHDYPPRQVAGWLSQLARQMVGQQQTEFYLERIQPGWLARRGQRTLYTLLLRFIIALIVGLCVGVSSAVSVSLISGLTTTVLNGLLKAPVSTLLHPQSVTLTVGLISGLASALLLGLFYNVGTEIKPVEMIIWSWRNIRKSLFGLEALASVITGLFIGAATWLAISLLIGNVSGTQKDIFSLGTIDATSVALLSGIASMLLFGVIYDIAQNLFAPYTIINPLVHSLSVGIGMGLLFGLCNGIAMGLSFGLYGSLADTSNANGPAYALYGGLALGLISACIGGTVLGIIHWSQRKTEAIGISILTRRFLWNSLSKRKAMLSGLLTLSVGFGLLNSWLNQSLGARFACQITQCGDTSWLFQGMSGLLGAISGLLTAASAFILVRLCKRLFRLSSTSPMQRLLLGILSGFLFGGLSTLFISLHIIISEQIAKQFFQTTIADDTKTLILYTGACSAFLIGGILGVLRGREEEQYNTINTTGGTRRYLTYRLLRSDGLRNLLLFGLTFGLIFGLTSGLIASDVISALPADVHSWIHTITPLFGLVFGLFFAILGVIIGRLILALSSGMSNETVDKSTLVTPNQGIHRSLRNSVLVGLIGGLLGAAISCSLGIGLYFLFSGDNNPDPTSVAMIALGLGLVGGVVSLLISALSSGGIACLQHSLLRIWLWRTTTIPWNYSRFLDYAARRVLLRKVGGGYIFIHRLLLEYFAALQITIGEDEPKQN